VTVRRTVLLATPLVALAVLLAADFALRANLTPAQASTYSLFFDVAFSAFAVGSTIAGTLIVVRQGRNVIGWLLLAVPLWAAFAFVAGDYATYALVTVPRSLPLAGPRPGSTAGRSCPPCPSRSCCSCSSPMAGSRPGGGGRCCGWPASRRP
jgi:hypothetical protein